MAGGFSGGYNDESRFLNTILEFDIEAERWTDTGNNMTVARGDHAVSVVDFGDYSDWCIALL